MKKIWILTALMVGSMILSSCDNITMTEAQRNVKEFILDKIRQNPRYELKDVLEVKVEQTDSLPTDLPITFATTAAVKASTQYIKKEITKKEFEDAISKSMMDVSYIESAWHFNATEDSLNFYNRAVYKVSVKMNNSSDFSLRVLMDEDGVTPRLTEAELGQEIEKATEDILNAQEVGWGNIW